MTRQILSTLGLIFVFLLSNSTTAQTLTEVVQITLRTNPEILASKYNVEAAEELHDQARAAYFPTIDLVMAGGREMSDNTTTRASGVDKRYLSRDEKSIRLTQLLFDGGATSGFVKQQDALAEAATARLVSSRENVSLRAVRVYLEVLRRDEVVDLAEENLRHHDNTLRKIEERFASGVGTKVDVVQTQGRRAQSRSNVLLSRRDADNGRAQFFRVVGEHPRDLERPAPISGLPNTLDQALKIAYQNNPALQAAEADLEAARAAHKRAEGVFYPRVNLELGATRNNDTDGTLGANDDETAVVRMTYNIYRGGADRARLNEAEAREFAAREAVRSVRRGVKEDVTLIWNELQDILLRLEYLEAHVRSTDEVLVVYTEKMRLGQRTLLDVLDIQN
ncbi:MAG: TolC family outer membrane protein, partial [Pseudomonadales bacterium]|nr:TolC family outer membrane protein [Pseudomonadales bacterium]